MRNRLIWKGTNKTGRDNTATIGWVISIKTSLTKPKGRITSQKVTKTH